MSHRMVMQVSTDLYLHLLPTTTHASFQATARKNIIFILAYGCLLHPPHLMWISGPSSERWIIYFAWIWHITTSRLSLASDVVKFIHHNSHTTLLTSVREPPRFACLCSTDSRASAATYPVHVLVCLRATCSIHTAWMTFGPLSTVLTWGTACATAIGWPY